MDKPPSPAYNLSGIARGVRGVALRAESRPLEPDPAHTGVGKRAVTCLDSRGHVRSSLSAGSLCRVWIVIVELLTSSLWFVLAYVVLFALNTGLAALAFRINVGSADWPLDEDDFWGRCCAAGALLAAWQMSAFFVSFVIVGPDAAWLFWILLVPYPILGAVLFSWCFALSDGIEGTKLFVLHHIVPLLLLLLAAFVSSAVRRGLTLFYPWT